MYVLNVPTALNLYGIVGLWGFHVRHKCSNHLKFIGYSWVMEILCTS